MFLLDTVSRAFDLVITCLDNCESAPGIEMPVYRVDEFLGCTTVSPRSSRCSGHSECDGAVEVEQDALGDVPEQRLPGR